MRRCALLPRALFALLLSTGLLWVSSPPFCDAADKPKKPTPLVSVVETQILFTISTGQIVTDYEIVGNDKQAVLAALEQYSTAIGAPVYRTRLHADVNCLGLSLCLPTNRGKRCFILLDSVAGVNNQAHTLIHELAHIRHHQTMTGLRHAEAEIVAETVTYLVSLEIGMGENTYISMSYLMQFPETIRRATLEKYEKEIREWAAELVKVVQIVKK